MIVLASITALLSVLLGAVCWILYALLRQNGRLLLRLDDLEAALSKSPGDSLANSRINRSGLTAGTMAPDFRLPTLDGGETSLADYAGRWLLLVFSDPECAPCVALLPRLQRAAREADAAVLIISRRDVEANRRKVSAAGVTLRVALQRHWEISRLYGKFATPIAYLVDPRGRIAEEVATGAEAILALLSNRTHTRTRAAAGNLSARPLVH
jgi:peroxiredoxin